MQTTQHSRCPVLLHPACTSNPDAIRAVQQATGRLVVIQGGKPRLQKPKLISRLMILSGTADQFRCKSLDKRFFILDEETPGPFGGDAA